MVLRLPDAVTSYTVPHGVLTPTIELHLPSSNFAAVGNHLVNVCVFQQSSSHTGVAALRLRTTGLHVIYPLTTFSKSYRSQ